jgi:hypothetical protein
VVWCARYTLGAHYLYIKRNVEKVWGARYLPENMVFITDKTLIYIRNLDANKERYKAFEHILEESV